MLDSWIHDIRYAARLLRRNPLFALTASLSLGIGIGATTTIFSIANGLLLRPPVGVADPARVVDIGRTQDGRDFDTNSYPNYVEIRNLATTLSGVYAYRNAEPISLSVPSGSERIYGSLVSANYFEVLGVRPRLGRLLISSDDVSEDGVVVIGSRLWADRFNADASIIGRSITLNGRPFTVVGVAPEHFQGTTVLTSDVWVPIVAAPEIMPRHDASLLTNRGATWLVMGGRLKQGVSLAVAQAELNAIAAALVREFPDENRGRGLRVDRLSSIPGNTKIVAGFLGLLTGIVGMVLVIASTNVAGVLLARAAARRREMAVRLAIGASRGRLIRQLITETMLLFAIGAGAGVAMARVMTALLVAILPTLPVPASVSFAIDGRVLAFAIGIALVAATLSGLVPALEALRANLVGGLKEGTSGAGSRGRLRHAFVVGQVALSLVLIVAAGLFVRALQRADAIDRGFDPRGVELASIDLSLAGYTDRTGPVFARTLLERVHHLPDVESATLAAILPLGGDALGLGGLQVPGKTPQGQPFLDADWNVVEPGWFETLRMPLVRGRDFNTEDRDGKPFVVIVNETAARQWWPGEDPVGKVLRQQTGGPRSPETRPLQVIGVARDAKYRFLGDPPRPFVFVPLAQQYLSRMTIVARTRDGHRIAAALRNVLRSMNPNLPIVTAQTLEDYAAIGLVPQRVAASLAGSLGIVGLLLAAIGIYGITSYMVTSRTREIGIRMALGADAVDVVRLVLRQGMTLALFGVAIGLALAATTMRAIGSLLFGVQPNDAITFGGAAALFCAVALAACYVPAKRALSIAASDALRHE